VVDADPTGPTGPQSGDLTGPAKPGTFTQGLVGGKKTLFYIDPAGKLVIIKPYAQPADVQLIASTVFVGLNGLVGVMSFSHVPIWLLLIVLAPALVVDGLLIWFLFRIMRAGSASA
jgi:hypothetical protein